MKKLFSVTFLLAAASLGCMGQAVVNMPINQNPLFEVSTNSVTLSIPENSSATIGGDLVIVGGSGNYTYRWYKSGDETLGEESTLEITEPGTYMLDVEDSCDCRQTISFLVESSGISAVGSASFSITPNPTDGIIAIEGFEAVQIAAVSMNGTMAALLVSETGHPFTVADLSHLHSGTYIITLTDANGKSVAAKLIRK